MNDLFLSRPGIGGSRHHNSNLIKIRLLSLKRRGSLEVFYPYARNHNICSAFQTGRVPSKVKGDFKLNNVLCADNVTYDITLQVAFTIFL